MMVGGLNEEQRKVVDQILGVLRMAETLPEPDRSKCMVCLAYEYFLLDIEEEGFKLLKKADPNYFKNHLKSDMEAIPDMKIIVQRIIGKLIESGYVEVDFGQEKR